ncbi:MAG: hypothetical protein Kilf2KO_26710 [Rhodospirillales bacterium]
MTGDKTSGTEEGFDLEGASGAAFEEALRRAEADLERPLEQLIPQAEIIDDDPIEQAVEGDAPRLEEDSSAPVVLQLTVRESDGLIGEFSGAGDLQASTPSESLTVEAGEGSPFRAIARSGAEETSEAYEDWLTPVTPETPAPPPEQGGLTAQDSAVLLGDFSGAESVPPAPPPEPLAFENDGLPSLTAAEEGGLLSEFSGAEGFREGLEGHDDLDELIFSADPRAADEGLPRVTERTEPEFLFKR